MGEIRVAEAIR